MSDIHVLPKDLVNKISAGEVVDRPASVVKELLENAIDAGATNINLTIKGAGKELISVFDNGRGISKQDIPVAVERHATSKINSLDDLNNVQTFGFRGEALAAVSSVSRMEILSSNNDSGLGYSVKLIAGEITHQGEIDFPRGTRVIVEDLFFNTPARRKFLKSEATEANRIFMLLDRIIFGNPKIRFQVMHKRSSQVFPVAPNLFSRLTRLVPKEISDFLIPIDKEDGGVRITGFIGHPSIAKERRYQQWVYVNDRVIFSPLINKAVYRGFHTLLMRNQHPLYYIKIDLSPLQVDVNIHPTKAEVKFANGALVSTIIAEAVRNTLTSQTRTDFLNVQNYNIHSRSSDDLKAATTSHSVNTPTKGDSAAADLIDKDYLPKAAASTVADDKKVVASKISGVDSNIDNIVDNDKGASLPIATQESLLDNATDVSNTEQISEKSNQRTIYSIAELSEKNTLAVSELEVLAQFDKYIIAQKNDNLLLFDAHATHERILYENIKQDFINKKIITCPLLEPEIIKLAPYELFVLEVNHDLWQNLGFEFRNLGNNDFAVASVPQFMQQNILSKKSIREIMHSVFTSLAEFDSLVNIDNYYHQVYATVACHTAIRGTEKLTISEMNSLLGQVSKLDIDLYCPHGRPIFQVISSVDIDKIFKRVT